MMTATILVLEDTDAVRDLCVDVLQHAGYHAIGAAGVPEATKIVDELDTPVDLLLADLTMPRGQSSLRFADDVRRRWPNVEVLLISGSEPDDALPYPFLPKPFSPGLLVTTVADLLQR